MSYMLKVMGQPVPKGRPRCGKDAAGNTRAYTPAKTRTAEEAIGWAWKETYGNDPYNCHVSVTMSFTEGQGGKPSDIDNLVKLALDALNGIAWTDDRQVVELHAHLARKRDGFPRPTPCTQIWVHPIDDGLWEGDDE